MAVKGKQLKTNKVNPTSFNLDGKEYAITMDFNVLAELEDIYGDIEKAFDDLQEMKIKAIRALIYSIVKVEDETVTLKGVGKMLNMNFMTEFAEKMGVVFANSMPEREEGQEDENMGE